jgi:hypothetical protein
MEQTNLMNIRTLSLITILVLVFVMGILLVSCGASSSSGASNGQALMQDRCTVCHSLTRVTSAHKTADEWKLTVDRMVNRGAQLSTQEEQALIEYLAQNYK